MLSGRDSVPRCVQWLDDVNEDKRAEAFRLHGISTSIELRPSTQRSDLER